MYHLQRRTGGSSDTVQRRLNLSEHETATLDFALLYATSLSTDYLLTEFTLVGEPKILQPYAKQVIRSNGNGSNGATYTGQ